MGVASSTPGKRLGSGQHVAQRDTQQGVLPDACREHGRGELPGVRLAHGGRVTQRRVQSGKKWNLWIGRTSRYTRWREVRQSGRPFLRGGARRVARHG